MPSEELTEVEPTSTSSEAVTFQITVVQGPDAGAAVRIDAASPSAILIGKSATCQLVLRDSKVSRRHLSLELAGSLLRVIDLESTNGTTVNGVILNEGLLRGGEVLGLGNSTLHVERHNDGAHSRVTDAVSFGRVVGASVVMRRLYPLFERFAASNVALVIEGAAGTGKELLAEELHDASPRRGAPFVVFDCSSIAPPLMEAQLFGDPASGARGAFDAALGGTLVIDEIAELPSVLQGKLLRVLESGDAGRAGLGGPGHAGVRLISLTRRDLEKEIESGLFREDLYYALAVGRIELPPLRRRRGDVALLADYFCKKLRPGHALPPDFLRRYDGYLWPGNVRELQHAVSRRLALGDVGDDDDDDVKGDESAEGAPENAFSWILEQDLPFSRARDLVTEEFERSYVTRVLAEHGGNVSKAASASGLARRYFQIIRARTR